MTRHDRDLLYVLEGAFNDMVFIGPVAEGLRMNGHFGGTVTVGELTGATMTGVDYFRVRPDGVGVVDGHEVMTFNGQTIAVRLNGYIVPPDDAPTPTAEQLSAPDFAWPDVDAAIQVLATFQTAAPELAHLNRIAVAHTGTVNMGTGRILVKAWRLDGDASRPGRREALVGAAEG